MKKLNLLITFFLIMFFQMQSQAFVQFEEAPKMKLTALKQSLNYKINYKAVKESTIYLELKKGTKIVASGIYDINKASTRVVKINMTVLKKFKKLEIGNDYSYKLYMYEGARNDWTKKACKTITINGVSVK